MPTSPMEQQNTLMSAQALDALVVHDIQIMDVPCHIMPGEEHSAILVNPRPSELYAFYRCQMKWWEATVIIGGDGTWNVNGVSRVASALSSPPVAAKRLAKKGKAFR